MKVTDYLTSKGIDVTHDGGYAINCEYKGNKIYLTRCSCNYQMNSCWSMRIGDKSILTRANITTIVGRILNLKESE